MTNFIYQKDDPVMWTTHVSGYIIDDVSIFNKNVVVVVARIKKIWRFTKIDVFVANPSLIDDIISYFRFYLFFN